MGDKPDSSEGNTRQKTLTGDEVTAVECDYYEICSNQAKYEVETLEYDGLGWVWDTRLACELCKDEHTEVGNKEVRPLRASERWTDGG